MARVNGITQFLPATHTTIPTLPRKHSPDAPPEQGGTQHTTQILSLCLVWRINVFIYRHRKDERLSWPSWLTYSGRFTHIRGHPSAAGRAWDRESSAAKDQRSNF